MSFPQAALKVRGNADDVDSFCACLSAAADYFGLRSDYTFLAGLSGACFSPCHNRGEDCISWMMDGGGPARVEFITWALGMRLARIELAPGAPEGWQEEYNQSGTLPPQAGEYFAALRQALAEGKLALLPTWPAWSLLTGWNEDLARLPFTTVRGFERAVTHIRPPWKTTHALTLLAGGLPRLPEEVFDDALSYAAGIATGEIHPGPAGFGDQNVFGGEMYEVILGRLDQEMLCPGCNENGCFARAARRLHDGHAAARGFIQEARSQAGSLAERLEPVEAGYTALGEISSHWAGLAKNPDVFDQPELRPRMREDFLRMQKIHSETAAHLAGAGRC